MSYLHGFSSSGTNTDNWEPVEAPSGEDTSNDKARRAPRASPSKKQISSSGSKASLPSLPVLEHAAADIAASDATRAQQEVWIRGPDGC